MRGRVPQVDLPATRSSTDDQFDLTNYEFVTEEFYGQLSGLDSIIGRAMYAFTVPEP